jgi:hypothetical protein
VHDALAGSARTAAGDRPISRAVVEAARLLRVQTAAAGRGHYVRMPDTASRPSGMQPHPTGPFGEGAPDLPPGSAEPPSHPGDSVRHVSRSAPVPRVRGDEDTAERPPAIERPGGGS